MKTEPNFNAEAACESCGCFGAYEFDGHRLCGDCYETRGSCCPEFGRDDLWRPDVLERECKPDGGKRQAE